MSDLLIRELLYNETDSVHDMGVLNTDTKSHSVQTPKKCLQEADWAKKKMYLEVCLQQRRNFFPFVASINGLLGVKAMATLKRIDSQLATK